MDWSDLLLVRLIQGVSVPDLQDRQRRIGSARNLTQDRRIGLLEHENRRLQLQLAALFKLLIEKGLFTADEVTARLDELEPIWRSQECPVCGFGHKWDGSRCGHCGFGTPGGPTPETTAPAEMPSQNPRRE